ncbi:MAG TPA: hypothetical protein VFE05_05150 [Longimicrobiaceae bacterium]|jgi:hypothetical protein|nr:hypothetical protein [Longimicrobiaceae bacterium]
MYRSGDLRDLRDYDPHHGERTEADAAALARSIRDRSGFFGVWTGAEAGSELLAIAHDGALFRSR